MFSLDYKYLSFLRDKSSYLDEKIIKYKCSLKLVNCQSHKYSSQKVELKKKKKVTDSALSKSSRPVINV